MNDVFSIVQLFSKYSEYKDYLKSKPKDLWISRIFPLCRFEELIRTGELTLVKPQMWEDDFLESYFSKISDNKIRWNGSNLYAQCWTDNIETRQLSERYCPDSVGVRVHTNLALLNKYFLRMDRFFLMKDYYTGKVQYHPFESIEEFIQSDFVHQSNSSSDTAYMRSLCLFMKDDSYAWEHEIRIVLEDSKSLVSNDDLYKVPVDLDEIILRIELDPRMTLMDKTNLRKLLCENGIDVNLICNH